MSEKHMAKWITEDIPGKPAEWPTYNLREAKINRVWQRVRDFYKRPDPVRRDMMLREAFCRQRGDLPSFGPKYRVSEYEVVVLTRIYFAGCCFNSWTLKLFAYHVVMEWIALDRFYEKRNTELSIDKMVITESRKRSFALPLQLRLFYEAYYACCEDWAQRRFGVILHKVCSDKLQQKQSKKDLWTLEHAIVSLLYDISGALGTDRDSRLSLNREEISNLIELEACIFRKRHLSIMRRPLKGTLMIQLSNLILKSRQGGTPSRVYKYIRNKNLQDAFVNKQIWLRDVRDLNDRYEGVVAKEIVDSVIQNGLVWAKKSKLKYKKKFFVNSYSKELGGDDIVSRYGECVLGYFGDRIVDYIAPLYWHSEHMPWNKRDEKELFPTLSQIAVLDVIYDKEEASSELQYLILCIDKLGQTDNQKRRFLDEILQYWKLSFKDAVHRDPPNEKWSDENERRYVIFYYDEYDYRGSIIDKDRMLKFETTAIIAPDFLLGKPTKLIGEEASNILKKFYECSTFPDYYVCDNCFAKGVFPDGFVGKCRECDSKSLTVFPSKAFHFK